MTQQVRIYRPQLAKRWNQCRMTIIRRENKDPNFPKKRVDSQGRVYYPFEEIVAYEALDVARTQALELAAAGLGDDPDKAAVVLNGGRHIPPAPKRKRKQADAAEQAGA